MRRSSGHGDGPQAEDDEGAEQGPSREKQGLTERLRTVLRPRSPLFDAAQGRSRVSGRNRAGGEPSGGDPPQTPSGDSAGEPGAGIGDESRETPGEGNPEVAGARSRPGDTEGGQGGRNTQLGPSSSEGLRRFPGGSTRRRQCPPTTGPVTGLRDDYRRRADVGRSVGDPGGDDAAVDAVPAVRDPVLASAIRVLGDVPALNASTAPGGRPEWARRGVVAPGGEDASGVSTRPSWRSEQQAPLSQVRPPLRYIRLYYNDSAESPLSVITLDTDLFGDMLSLVGAPSTTRAEQAEYLEAWVAAAHAHGVVPRDLHPYITEELRQDSFEAAPALNGAAGPVINGAVGVGRGGRSRTAEDAMGLLGRDSSLEAWWRTYGWRRYGVSSESTPSPGGDGGVGGAAGVEATPGDAPGADRDEGEEKREQEEDAASKRPVSGELGRVLKMLVKKGATGDELPQGRAGQELEMARDVAAGSLRVSSSTLAPSERLSEADLSEVFREAGLSDAWDAASKAEALGVLQDLRGVDRPGMVDLLRSTDRAYLAGMPEQPEGRDTEEEEDSDAEEGVAERGGGADKPPVTFGWGVLDAVEKAYTERVRSPRVIVIGDVHGCLDELRRLIREVDYWPGDLLLFLGDLVSHSMGLALPHGTLDVNPGRSRGKAIR